MRSRPEAQEKARELRSAGASIKQIAAAVGASPSSVSGWVRDIALTAEQRAALDERVRRNGGHPRAYEVLSSRARDKRIAGQRDGRERAAAGSPLHQAGCMLYWAEGSKQRNTVTFTNADADMVAFFLRFLREEYGVRDDQVALTVNCFLGNGLTLDEIEDWWLRRLELPRSCLRKPAVNRASRASKGIRAPLLHGTARLVVSSTFIVQSIYGAIQEYAGCDRPEWLDIGVRALSPGFETTGATGTAGA